MERVISEQIGASVTNGPFTIEREKGFLIIMKRFSPIRLFAGIVSLMFACHVMGVDQTTPGWIEFEVPGLDVPESSVGNVGFLNKEPAGSHGFLRVKDAHFVDDRGIQLRFWGTNIAGRSCFLPEEDAVRLAKRLRQWGMNCVRLHMLDDDHPYHKGYLIWEDPAAGTFSEANLRKLDRLIAACKAEGIYINIDLHCSWRYRNPPEFSQDYPGHYRYGKLRNIWDPNAIADQKMYNKALLTRINTVTGIRYADDPAIFCLGLNNENSLLAESRDSFFKLPASMQDEMNRQWTGFLKRKYDTDAALRKAWGTSGAAVISQPAWNKLDMDGGASALVRQPDGSWKWNIAKPGKNPWSVLMTAALGSPVAENGFSVRFRIRGTAGAGIKHYFRVAGPPYKVVLPLYYNDRLKLTGEWQTVEIGGKVRNYRPEKDKLLAVFELAGDGPVEFELMDYSVQQKGDEASPQSLDTGMAIPPKGSKGLMERDYQQFLLETEIRSVEDMRIFLRDEVGYKGLIVNTVAGYFTLGGQYRESKVSDFLDHHDYYQHPNRNRGGLSFENSPMEADSSGGTLPLITFWREFGKPFTVSEANTPSPNDHSADFLPMDAIMFSIQDWDAFYSYAYGQWKTDLRNTTISDPFHLAGKSNVMVHQPFAALLYRQRRMPMAAKKIVLELPVSKIVDYMVKGQHAGEINAVECGASNIGSYSARRGFLFRSDIESPRLSGGNGKPQMDGDVVVSEDGSFRLHRKDPAGAYAMLNLPNARMLAGSVGGRRFEIGDAKLEIAARPWPHAAPAFACVTLVTLDGKPVAESSRMLLAASARTEPQNLAWNKDRTGLTAADSRKLWGNGPNLSEMVPLHLTLPGGAYSLTPLNGEGIPVGNKRFSDTGTVAVTQNDNTLWYLIER